jgi:adenosine deaminase CECR1
MNIHGWKQLAEWSIEYSCLSKDDALKAYGIFAREWETFCEWIIAEYGELADSLDISP